MCDSESTICVNLVPSYKCICKIGYTMMSTVTQLLMPTTAKVLG